jgi:hypothetical protein
MADRPVVLRRKGSAAMAEVPSGDFFESVSNCEHLAGKSRRGAVHAASGRTSFR